MTRKSLAKIAKDWGPLFVILGICVSDHFRIQRLEDQKETLKWLTDRDTLQHDRLNWTREQLHLPTFPYSDRP